MIFSERRGPAACGLMPPWRPESFDEAIAWYQQAIARDPNFALAMARLAECRLSQHWFVETFTEAELAEVRKTAEHALALAPDLAQAHVSHGLFYYYGYRQYEQALAEFGRALQLQPNNAQALEYSGYVYRRQGQWQRCLDTLKKSLEQDPRNADVAGNLSQTYCILRMWQDAERVGKYALSIDPSDVIGMRALLLAILNGSGDIKRAQGVLATFPSTNDLISSSASGIVASVTGDRAYTFVFARDFEAALKVWETSADTAADQRRRLSAKAAIRALAGDFTGAQADAEKARQLLEERLRERPNERVSMRELIWVYLALKRDADAQARAVQEMTSETPRPSRSAGSAFRSGSSCPLPDQPAKPNKYFGGFDSSRRTQGPYRALGKNSCSPPILKSAIVFCPSGETTHAMNASPRSFFTCGCFAGFTSMIPYWLKSLLSPSTRITSSPRFLNDSHVPRSAKDVGVHRRGGIERRPHALNPSPCTRGPCSVGMSTPAIVQRSQFGRVRAALVGARNERRLRGLDLLRSAPSTFLARRLCRVGFRTDEDEVVVHHRMAVDALCPSAMYFPLRPPGMHEDDVGIAPPPYVERLSGPDGNHPHLDPGLLFVYSV